MVGLVEEIQRDALSSNTSVSTLLRKVRLAAAKLDLPKIEAWVESELNGYSGNVPPYRVLNGRPMAHNPMRGWMPFRIPAWIHEKISECATGQSVGEIEALLSETDGDLHIPMDRRLVDILNQNMRVPFAEMSVFVNSAQLAGILDKVRTMILDWAIALERAGIRGESMSFKDDEKAIAQSSPAITIGSGGTIIGVVGNNNNFNDINVGSFNLNQVRNLTEQISENQDMLVSAGADGPKLSKAIEKLQREIEKTNPDTGILKGLLQDTRAALAGASGSLMATGALSLIGSLLGG